MSPQPQNPWDGQPDAAACNYATGHLIHGLERRLTVDGRIHAETLLAAAGVVSGFSALRALMAYLAETKDPALLGQLNIVQSKSGAKYYFGEPLDRMLLPANPAESSRKLWSLAAGGAVAAGLDPAQLPELGPMFLHVTQTLGGDFEGWPSLSKEHYPIMPFGELLRVVWPLSLLCYAGRIPGAPREFGMATVQNWPAISARAAAAFIQKVKAVLPPAKSLTIVMDAAIYASKLDPEPIDKAVMETNQAPLRPRAPTG